VFRHLVSKKIKFNVARQMAAPRLRIFAPCNISYLTYILTKAIILRFQEIHKILCQNRLVMVLLVFNNIFVNNYLFFNKKTVE